MELKTKAEIRLLIDFLFRQLFSQQKYLRKEGYTDEDVQHLISMQAHTGLAVIQRSRYATHYIAHDQQPDVYLLKNSLLKFMEHYNGYSFEWYDIQNAGYPITISVPKTELAAISRINQITDFMYNLYSNQAQGNQN